MDSFLRDRVFHAQRSAVKEKASVVNIEVFSC